MASQSTFERENGTPEQKSRLTQVGRTQKGSVPQIRGTPEEMLDYPVPDKGQHEQPNILFRIGGKTHIKITVKNLGQAPELY